MTATPPPDHARPWVWVDTETTGLNERTGAILEVGLIVTDAALTIRAERSWAVRYVGEVDPAIAKMHGPSGSGLIRASACTADCRVLWRCEGLPPEQVEAMAVAWLAEQCNGVAPLWCGRNVAFDRRWIRHHMPRLHDAFSHRSIDETTLRIALAGWAGLTVPKDATTQGNRHRALDDLHECLRVARIFRDRMAPPRAGQGSIP